MSSQPTRTIPVKLCERRSLEARLESAEDQTRQRAYDLYCKRGQRDGTALEDWIAAEREREVAPLVGIADEERDFHITACIGSQEPSEIAVEALPDEIVVEADRNGKIERFTRVRMPSRIDAQRVKAELCGTKLEVNAPKAGK